MTTINFTGTIVTARLSETANGAEVYADIRVGDEGPVLPNVQVGGATEDAFVGAKVQGTLVINPAVVTAATGTIGG